MQNVQNEMDEGVNILVNSCINMVDIIGVKGSRKSCAARLWEGRSYTISKFRKAVTMKISVEGSKRYNIVVDCEKLKTIKERS